MSETMCYVGRKQCGCVVTVATDKPEYAKDVAREVARWVREGLTIERMSVKEVHKTPLGCLHSKPKKTAKQHKLLWRQH